MDWFKDKKLILASGSPRRAELLKLAGFEFQIRTKEVEESYPENLPVYEVAEFLAIKKAVAQKEIMKEDEILIAADSVVIQDGTLLGKPVDRAQAVHMIESLSGKQHIVITGVCLLNLKKQKSFSVTSKVFVSEIKKEEIKYYIDNYKPFDKAGAYGIQEWIGFTQIKGIEGSYPNIMGLPMQALYQELREF